MAILRAAVVVVALVVTSSVFAADDGGMTCGREMAGDAEVPEKWGRLMSHVATQMHRHAAWVGAATPEARRERDGLERVAAEYQAIADASTRAAAAMRAMRDLPAAPHDPRRLDRAVVATWMRDKIAMQRDFARLLERHATESEEALRDLEVGQRR
jgi:hypothetical protein